MASDVSFLVIDPSGQVVVLRGWIGMGGTVERVYETLARPADHAECGWESWGRLRAEEALIISASAYSGGADEAQVRVWLRDYPPERYWWTIVRDY